MPKAKVMNSAVLGLAGAARRTTRATSSDRRGLKITLLPTGGLPTGTGLSASTRGFRRGVGRDRPRAAPSTADTSIAMAASSTTSPTFDWPKMPPSEKFVPPVQTASGVPARSRTMNLLWLIADFMLRRGMHSAAMPAAAAAACVDRAGKVLVAMVVDDLQVDAPVDRRLEHREERRMVKLVGADPQRIALARTRRRNRSSPRRGRATAIGTRAARPQLGLRLPKRRAYSWLAATPRLKWTSFSPPSGLSVRTCTAVSATGWSARGLPFNATTR